MTKNVLGTAIYDAEDGTWRYHASTISRETADGTFISYEQAVTQNEHNRYLSREGVGIGSKTAVAGHIKKIHELLEKW